MEIDYIIMCEKCNCELTINEIEFNIARNKLTIWVNPNEFNNHNCEKVIGEDKNETNNHR